MSKATISDLVGKTLTTIVNTKEEIIFTTDKEYKYKMFHSQNCCEDVYVDDIVGDVNDLLNTPILYAEEVSNINDPPKENSEESYTWTFYNIRTIIGSVTIKWYGTSNGYYSEEVDFAKIND
jgi:hypothetical protein